MTLLRTSLISFFAMIALTATAATPPTLNDIDRFSFVNMQNDTTISVSFTSAGCFHYESGVMTFTPETVAYGDETKTVGFEDMAGVDKYLRNLAHKQGQLGGCTSSTTLTLTLNRDGQAVGQKTLRDDFCFREDGMVSPDSLRYRLFEQEEAEQLSLIEK